MTHEDTLGSSACDRHKNEGGLLIRDLTARLARVEALAEEWECWANGRSTPRIDAFRDAAASIRAAIGRTA